MDNIISDYNASTFTKVTVLTGTAIASALCVQNMMRRNNIKHLKNLEMGIREGIELCCASTAGGFISGWLVDNPKHRKAKYKDVVNQIIGNTFIPFGFLALANKCTTKLSKVWRTLVAIGTFISTTFLGHNIANKLNKKIFKEESGYKCSFKDIISDADDWVLGASTVLKSKGLYQFTAAVAPLTYTIHGYLSGCRQQDKKLDKYV